VEDHRQDKGDAEVFADQPDQEVLCPDGPMVEPLGLVPGARVWVERLGTEGEIVDAPARGGRVRVAAGAMRVWVEPDDLRSAGRAEPAPAAAPDAVKARARPAREAPRTGDNTVDLRGMRVDDALALLETSLDRLYGAEEPTVYVLHGIGTGALRDAVRAHLRADTRYVERVRAGDADDGGDRVTVVTLR
jgi:DNA mismatch repair protein MutS2